MQKEVEIYILKHKADSPISEKRKTQNFSEFSRPHNYVKMEEKNQLMKIFKDFKIKQTLKSLNKKRMSNQKKLMKYENDQIDKDYYKTLIYEDYKFKIAKEEMDYS